jgi:hypothetical protein
MSPKSSKDKKVGSREAVVNKHLVNEEAVQGSTGRENADKQHTLSQQKMGGDNFSQYVLKKIDPQVFKTLNLLQLEAISQAIAGTDKSKRHAFDFRGAIPLFFRRYYFVMLAGRDRRSATRTIEAGRRKSSSVVALLLMSYCVICGAVFFCLLALYLLKSFLGIDLFADKHLWDWFL